MYFSWSEPHAKVKLGFINSKWIENSAPIGAAMVMKPALVYSIPDGVFPTPVVSNCSTTQSSSLHRS